MIVVDSNIIAYFLLNNEFQEEAEAIYKKDPQWCAPLLWRSEVRNILVHYQKKKLLDLKQSKSVMNKALKIMKNNEYSPVSNNVLELAGQSGCTAYDCEFVSVATSLKTRLITNDKQILSAFPKVAVKMSEYLKES